MKLPFYNISFSHKNILLLFSDKILVIGIIIFLAIFNPNHIMMLAYFSIIPYLLFTNREVLFPVYAIASLISIIWSVFAKNYYSYNMDFLTIFGVNTYPLFGWATGLFALYLLYLHYEKLFEKRNFLVQLGIFTLTYWVLMILLESIFYHGVGIQNLAASTYSSVPLCNCLHGPLWLQTAYFFIGPIFFSMVYLFTNKINPHYYNTK